MKIFIKYFIALFLIFIIIPKNTLSIDLTPEEIFEKVNSSVVVIYTYDFDNKINKQGSGVLINDSGIIITNYHVFSKSENIVIYHNSQKFEQVEILNGDYDKDLLILKVDNLNLNPIETGNSTNIKVGEKIYAIGSPLGYENTISEGIISGIRDSKYYIEKLIQITASISPGSSGGAIVNSNGELIGISTYQIEEGQNINFAIPINEIVDYKNSVSYEKIFIEGNQNFIKGYNAYEAKKYEDAVFYNTAYLKNFPESQEVYYNRGLAYTKLERFREAIKDFNKAMEFGDNSAAVYYSRGKCFQGLEEYDLALKDFNYAISLNPDLPESYNQRGECYLIMEDFKNAIKDFNTSIRLDNSFSTYFYNRGIAYEYLKDKKNALKDYSEAISIYPYYLNAYYSRGRLYNELGNFDNSIKDFDKCIELNPYYNYAYNNIGWVYFNKGDYSNAIINLEKCFEIDNTNWDALLGIATSYYAKGNLEKAKEYLSKSIKIEPLLKKGMEGISLLEKEGYEYKKSQKKIIEEMFDDFN